jgi:quercetin dioxygenase-like cupin family protein
MNKFDRRSTLAIGLAAVSAAMIKPAAAQTTDYKDTTPAPGVVVRAYSGETPSIIPGFKTVSMRDVILQPGSKTAENSSMMNPMVCHITEGELRVVQEGKTITAKKNFVWTCNKDTKEHVVNDGSVVAIMRITDLKA